MGFTRFRYAKKALGGLSLRAFWVIRLHLYCRGRLMLHKLHGAVSVLDFEHQSADTPQFPGQRMHHHAFHLASGFISSRRSAKVSRRERFEQHPAFSAFPLPTVLFAAHSTSEEIDSGGFLLIRFHFRRRGFFAKQKTWLLKTVLGTAGIFRKPVLY